MLFGAGRAHLVLRTRRALARLGLSATHAAHDDEALLGDGPVWLLREGSVPESTVTPLPASATGLPVVALGRATALPGAEKPASLEGAASVARLDEGAVWSVYVERPRALFTGRADGLAPARAVAEAVRSGAVRAFVHPACNVGVDPRLRVLELVTTLHRGGAERLVLDLHARLPRLGATSLLATTSRPVRTEFPAPESTLSVHGERLDEATASLFPDVVHAHLLDEGRLAALARASVPLVVHLHNAREGWPPGTELSGATLALACADAVGAEARALPFPSRVVWNGIAPGAAREGAREALRRDRGAQPGDVVLLALANVRPQKDLPHLVAVLEALVARGAPAWLWMVGEPVSANEASQAEEARLVARIQESPAKDRVLRLGPSKRPEDDLAAADVLVSASLHEGLSLAHLEALAAGLPVVAREVSGLAEVARAHPGRVTSVEQGARPEAFAERVHAALGAPREPKLAPDFHADTAARRTLPLLARAAGLAPHPAKVRVVFVTNNLVTGGAQSSLRRLAAHLAERGLDVGCVLVEEQAAYPSRGARDLAARGVSVHHAPCAREVDVEESALGVVRYATDMGASHVVFWNVIPEIKVLAAHALFGAKVFDVSPGEMFFASLDRYFARPRPGLSPRDARAFGALLEGVIVKFEAERARAESTLGARVHVVPNGVPLPAEVHVPREAPARLVLGTAARISPQKRLEELVDAFRLVNQAYPDAELRIAGGPDAGCEAYREELIARCEGLPVTFVGELADVGPFLAELDVFAAVSEPEGCPNATLEAMAAGLPVVATRAGAASEQIGHGESGILVPRADPGAFAEALLTVARDRALRVSLGRGARRRIEERFSMEGMAEGYLAAWGLGGRGRGAGQDTGHR